MSFTDRERDFEARFVHDQELRFRIEARRNKLIGLWAAEKLGKSGDDAEAYAQQVIHVAFQAPGDEGIVNKILGDFDAAGVDQSDHQIRRHLTEFLAEAETQIRAA
ncbi:DUF1476 domain-containing protein [Aurantimonas sp. VKM B-3413]|uniref:DUF1476 domain-containing protein n=1 Tax=Aurantimonas sp. VKM B-3413 TaxID=2779401 RepID=UPI001E297555|nr:DUF1476 domain-containing protein [Aurantimonas sp. VKM B-3413]MCB8839723.1 DUF1476 domain-containing protein [Aurantimonas sp. VKM B-3413]